MQTPGSVMYRLRSLKPILSELGYIADCSVVSGCNMLNYPGKTVAYGFDYRMYPNEAYLVRDNLIEIPMSVSHVHTLEGKSIKNRAKNALCRKYCFLHSESRDD